jgi:hypothetical protein
MPKVACAGWNATRSNHTSTLTVFCMAGLSSASRRIRSLSESASS